MRWLVCGLSIAIASPALAADYDNSWLRGSQVVGPPAPPPSRLYRNWSGVYGGVQVGEDFHGVDFVDFPARDSERRTAGHRSPTPGERLARYVYTVHYQHQRSQLWRLPRLQLADRRHGVRRGAQCQQVVAQYSCIQLGSRSYVVSDPNSKNIYSSPSVNVTASATADMSDLWHGSRAVRLGVWKLSALPRRRRFVRTDRYSRYVDISFNGTNISIPCRRRPPLFALLSAPTTRFPMSVMANMSSASTPPSAWITC